MEETRKSSFHSSAFSAASCSIRSSSVYSVVPPRSELQSDAMLPMHKVILGSRSPQRLELLSRLVPHKQIEDALDAIAELRKRIPDVHMDVLGGGWWKERLVDHAALLGIADAVTFHGHVDDETKHRVLQCCWVHVLPSRKEGWALAVTEAGQHAVPTVGYRSSGGLTDSIIDGVTGLLVDDHDELVDGIEQLLSDEVLCEQLGAKAQTRSGEFSWRQSADAMRAVLDSVHAGSYVSGVV